MVAHLKAAVINEVTGVVVHEGLDHPALLASQNQGVQVRLKGGRELGNIIQDVNALNRMGRLDDGSLPLQVYLESGLSILDHTARTHSKGAKTLRDALELLLASQSPQQAEPSFHWSAQATDLELLTAGTSSLLGIAWLEVGLAMSQAVARVSAGGIGTAFLVAPSLLLTNHHVAFGFAGPPDRETEAVAWFHYQDPPPGGAAVELVELRGSVRPQEANRQHDWALIRLDRPPQLPPIRLRRPGKPLELNDRVCIIQHPEGGPKKISVHKNLVRSITDGRVQYLTDTDKGSSGSPVFDERWDLVALHHAGKSVRVDNDRTENRNEGIAIETVIAGIRAQCSADLCRDLKI